MCVLAIVRQITPKVGVVRSRDLILQYDVKVGNKTANINVKKLVSLKHGVRAINQTENSTDPFARTL